MGSYDIFQTPRVNKSASAIFGVNRDSSLVIVVRLAEETRLSDGTVAVGTARDFLASLIV